jgi:hypothetical protein
MRTLRSTLSLALVLVACKGPEVPPPPAKSRAGEQPTAKPDPGIVMTAAGVSLTLPSTWTIAEERDGDFALAQGPGDTGSTCTIELRRQGLGELPKGARRRDKDEYDFTRGMLRGRVRVLPGPSEDSRVVIQCLAPRAAQWGAIEAAFDSQTSAPPDRVVSAPANRAGSIVQLCTSTPASPTYVCVRRDDGSVHCGVSDGDALTRIAGLEPSEQIACDGARACSRARESGALQCWRADTEPTTVAEITGARDLAGGCVVDGAGKVWCRERESNGLTGEAFAELVPFGDPSFALREAQQVLAGSSASQGCVLGTDGLRCWDGDTTLGLPLADTHQPHVIEAPSPALDLARFGDRVCIRGSERWTCIAGEQRLALDGCEQRSCGCSLLGSAQLSCDHEPTELGVALLGRISDVIATEGACAALADDTVVCRGPVIGRGGDSPRVDELVASGRPGALHVLEFRGESK